MNNLINRQAAINMLNDMYHGMISDESMKIYQIIKFLNEQPPAQQWIPVTERLPKINKKVLMSTNSGSVYVGNREKPNLVWQVTEEDGRAHWVYDPEAYTDDIDSLPKTEDCSFRKESLYEDLILSVTSVNYKDRFDGIVAWMPMPEPYKGEV